MKRVVLTFLLTCLSASLLEAVVVRPAPDILWLDANGVRQNLSRFKGQPVVILIAPSPRSWAFRSQVGQIQKMYQRLAAERIVFIAAFTNEPGLIRSNVPFAVAADGPRVAYEYQAGDRFAIAFIGKDGNLDYVTNRVVPVQRIYDIVGNSYVPQTQFRRR